MITEKCEECKENVPLLIKDSAGRQVYVLVTHYKMEGRCKGSGKLSLRSVKA